MMLLNKFIRFIDERKHSEPQKVEFDKPRVINRILVPLADNPPLGTCVFLGHYLCNRPGRNDHASHMDRKVPREICYLRAESVKMVPCG